MMFWGVLIIMGLAVPFPGTGVAKLHELGFKHRSGANGGNEIYQLGVSSSQAGFVLIKAAIDDGTVFMVALSSQRENWTDRLSLETTPGCKKAGKDVAECEVPNGPKFSLMKCGAHHIVVGPAGQTRHRVRADEMCEALRAF